MCFSCWRSFLKADHLMTERMEKVPCAVAFSVKGLRGHTALLGAVPEERWSSACCCAPRPL